MAITKQTSSELKTRVNTCLSKLSDRDTLLVATNELEAIARQLENDSFASFLSCLSATNSSEKSPVRRQCVRLLGILSVSHGDALSPHLSRMISTVLRRLRDPDSAVRSACVDAVSSITAHVNSPASFSVILEPLVDALFHEQELNAQIGASLCLSAAVEAAPEVDAVELRKLFPRVLKLVKSECFKGKPSLFLFISSLVTAGCAKNKGLLSSLIATVTEFLSCEDWAARKAAAEVMVRVAMAAERDLVVEFKVSCVAALESRRFDRVKVVRETMNRALETWRGVPELSKEASSLEASSSNGLSRNPDCSGLRTPQPRKTMPRRSPLSSCSSSSSSQKSVTRIDDGKPNISHALKLNLKKNSENKVVPFNCNDNEDTADGNAVQDETLNQNEFDSLSVIRKQLLQIGDQQSTLLDQLQRFIGNSQVGMSYLEKRVDGLEKVLGEMSQGLAISTPRISNTNTRGNSCCMISGAGAEFLSPKFWRRMEGQNLSSNFHSSFKNHSLSTSFGISKLDGPRN